MAGTWSLSLPSTRPVRFDSSETRRSTGRSVWVVFGGHDAGVGLGFVFVLAGMLTGVLGRERDGRLCGTTVCRRRAVSRRRRPICGVRSGEMRPICGVLALPLRNEALLLNVAPVLLHLLLHPGLLHLVLEPGHTAGKPVSCSWAQFPSGHFHGLFKMLVDCSFRLPLSPVPLILLPSLLLHSSLSLHPISLHPLPFSLISFFFLLPLSG